ncbi:TonB-dependent receptor plug domain-containing protein [Acetobacter conturbans]|uniref:TonB-dependent receptor n=1 Tax=Acetobacter conturbans TaxID=1737472 RepID=A0ABX0K1P8_9PROT|nr:TonB-dependent receptor [Acetobacter conturbans]NHN89624.1 TonB-dependent receptor [Acetobacter conturbans]
MPFRALLLTGASLLSSVFVTSAHASSGVSAASQTAAPTTGKPVASAAKPMVAAKYAAPAAQSASAARNANMPTVPAVLSEHTDTWPENITVSAARRAIPADEIGTAMTIITEKQILTQQRRSLTDILIRQPGLNVVRTGGLGGTTSIFMRGSNANEVKVRLDGMDINDGSQASGAFDAAQYMTDGLGRIEILRGPQSGLYGADAMAGVIDMTTAQGQGRFKPFVRVEGGGYGTFNQVLGARGSADRFHYNVELSHYRQVGFHSIPNYVERYAATFATITKEQRERGNTDDNRSANIRLGYDVMDNLDLGLTAHLMQSNYRSYGSYEMLDEAWGYAGRERERSIQNQAIVRGTAHLSSWGGLFDQVIGLGYMTNWRNFTYIGTNTDGTPRLYDPTYYRSDRLKIDWHGTLDLKKYGSLLIGAEHLHDTFNSSQSDDTGTNDAPYSTRASMDTTAGYGQYQGNWNQILYGAANIRYDSNSRYGHYVTWRVAPAIHIPGTGTVIKASAGSGFHGPSLYQLFGNLNGSYYNERANPNLRAERLIGYDVTVEQKLAHDRLHFGATWYENHVHNLIQSTVSYSSGMTDYSYANVERARMFGVEAFLNWKALDNLEFNLNYTWTHARDTSDNEPLQRRPQHKFNFNTTWKPIKDLTLSGNILYVSGWRDYPVYSATDSYCETCAKGHGYMTIDVAASYQINRYVTVFARADNLLNRQYENPVGYLQQGRAGYGGFTLTY